MKKPSINSGIAKRLGADLNRQRPVGAGVFGSVKPKEGDKGNDKRHD